MRIAFVRLPATPLIDPSVVTPFGGAEVRALTFAERVAELGLDDVQLVVQSVSARSLPAQGRLRVTGVPSDRRRSSGRAASWRWAWQGSADTVSRAWRSLRSRIDPLPLGRPEFTRLNVDLLALFGVHDPTAGIVRSARDAGIRSVVFATSDDDVARAMASHVPRRRDLWRHRWALLNADAVVVQTEFQQQCLRAAGQRAYLVRNPIDTQCQPATAVPWSQRRYILWVGRADTDSKRADLCLQVASRCPDVPFLVVMNPGHAQTTARLRSQVPDNVRLLEHVPWADSDSLYREARALLNTSESEGFPNAFLQAAKHSVPIVSRRVDPDQVLSRHRIGLVAGDSVDSLVEIVGRIYREPDTFQDFAARARRYVVSFHDAHQRACELRAVLTQVLNLATSASVDMASSGGGVFGSEVCGTRRDGTSIKRAS